MTRRNFFRSALACFGAMVLAPVRAVEPRVLLVGNWDGKARCTTRVFPWGKIHSGQWRGRIFAYSEIGEQRLFFSAVDDPTDWDYSPPV